MPRTNGVLTAPAEALILAALGAAPLGLRAEAYARLLTERPTGSKLADGTTKLVHTNAHLAV